MMEKNYDNRKDRLQRLNGSDYEVADGDPDIEDWKVKDQNGNKIGKVKDLIFDTLSLKVRYMVVDIDNDDLDLEERKVLVPIGAGVLDKDDDDVILSGVTVDQLRRLPTYDEDNFNSNFESEVGSALGVAGATYGDNSTNDMYNSDYYNDQNLYRNRRGENDNNSKTLPVIEENLEVGKRAVERGGIRLRSRVVEKDVSEDVNLRKETVHVDRRAVDRPATDADLSQANSEIEMHEREEVPVVNKEARVVEEITLDKEVTEETQTIKDTVRHTEVDIDREDESDLNQGTNTGNT